MRPPRAPSNCFRPSVETLEDRCVPSVSNLISNPSSGMFVLDNSVSPFKNQTHVIQIFDAGNGKFTVVADGVTTNLSGVTTFEYFGGNKKSFVFYDLTGNLKNAETVLVSLGKGGGLFNSLIQGNINPTWRLDLIGFGGGKTIYSLFEQGVVNGQFNYNIFGGPNGNSLNASLSGTVNGTENVNLFGGGGNDFINAFAFANVAATGNLNIQESGQGGNDHENLFYTGQVKGTLDASADGGAGDDIINEQLGLLSGSNGTVEASVSGGPGDDRLLLAIRKDNPGDPTTLLGEPNSIFPSLPNINGGGGSNTCFATSNVVSFNCQVKHVIF